MPTITLRVKEKGEHLFFLFQLNNNTQHERKIPAIVVVVVQMESSPEKGSAFKNGSSLLHSKADLTVITSELNFSADTHMDNPS